MLTYVNMKYLSAVVLFFLLAYDFCEGGYPKKLKIENTILAFLEFEDGKPFCSMATVSNLYGIAASTCVQGINLSIKQTFATSYEKKYSVKKKRKVIGMKGEDGMDITLTNTPLILIILEEGEEKPIDPFMDGLYGPEDSYVSLSKDPVYIYGYSKTDLRPVSVVSYEVTDFNDNTFTFKINSKKTEIILKGAPVIYQRSLIAICNSEPVDQLIQCLLTYKMNKFVLSLEKRSVDITEKINMINEAYNKTNKKFDDQKVKTSSKTIHLWKSCFN